MQVFTGTVLNQTGQAMEVVAMAMLGAHLHHGIWSSLQTMGLTSNANARTRAKQFGFVVALIITVGFSVVPVFILAGVITK